MELVESCPLPCLWSQEEIWQADQGKTVRSVQPSSREKLTVKEPRRTMGPWRTQGRRAQQSSSSNKSTPLKGKAKESDKGTTSSPLSKIKSLRWKRVKLVKQIARTKDEEQILRKKAAEALVEAENVKFKMPRKLQTRPCSLQRRRNFRNWSYRGSRTSPTKLRWAQRTCLLALAPDSTRRAAREFSTHTTMSTDGFAMRHFCVAQ